MAIQQLVEQGQAPCSQRGNGRSAGMLVTQKEHACIVLSVVEASVG